MERRTPITTKRKKAEGDDFGDFSKSGALGRDNGGQHIQTDAKWSLFIMLWCSKVATGAVVVAQ